MRDIAARERAEQELRLTQFSVEHTSDGIFWLDPQSRIVYANETRCRTLGYFPDELLSLSIPEIDPSFPKERWKEFWEKIKRQGSMTFEACNRTKEGRVFPVEVIADYLEFGGKEYVMAFAHDISARNAPSRPFAIASSAIGTSLSIAPKACGGWSWNSPYPLTCRTTRLWRCFSMPATLPNVTKPRHITWASRAPRKWLAVASVTYFPKRIRKASRTRELRWALDMKTGPSSFRGATVGVTSGAAENRNPDRTERNADQGLGHYAGHYGPPPGGRSPARKRGAAAPGGLATPRRRLVNR